MLYKVGNTLESIMFNKLHSLRILWLLTKLQLGYQHLNSCFYSIYDIHCEQIKPQKNVLTTVEAEINFF